MTLECVYCNCDVLMYSCTVLQCLSAGTYIRPCSQLVLGTYTVTCKIRLYYIDFCDI